MSAIKVNGTWQQVASVKVKRNAVWVDHTAFYSRLEGAWHVIDLNAEAVGPAYHVWKAYADDEQGNGISLLPEGKEYIGFAVGQTTEQPKLADPSIFDWSLIKGTDGEDVDPEVLNEILTKQDDIAVAVDDVESRLKAADGGLASALATAEHNFTVSLNKANALIVTTDERITDGVSRIDTAIEGLDATIKSTDTRLTSNIASADSKIASAATAIGNVQNDITGLSSLTGSHGSAITDLETTTDEQAQRVTVLETSDDASKARVTTLEKTSAGHASRLSNVETKSTTAVDKANAAQGSANAANTKVRTVTNRVTGLEETSEGHASRLTNVETKSTGAVTKADAAQGSANSANTKVATVTSRVTGLEETSTGHASRLTNVETKSTSAVTKADAAQSTADSGVFKADTAQGTANSGVSKANTAQAKANSVDTKVTTVTNRVGTLEETSTGHASRLTNVETKSTSAVTKAGDAQDTADSGVSKANAAQAKANAATTIATAATNRVSTLEETSEGHASRLSTVETTAITAVTRADDAQDTADSGVGKAAAAQSTANSGVSKANAAQAKANSATTKVTAVTNRVGTLEETSTGHASRLTNVETTATTATTKANDAQDTADSGVSKANAAQAKANSADGKVNTVTNRVSSLEETSEDYATRFTSVETTSESGVSKANVAQSTANSGVSKANAAQVTANSGVSKANAAKGLADDAQDTADSGVSKANAAQAKANSADSKVNKVTNRVGTLEETSTGHASRLSTVETKATTGVSKADAAQLKADYVGRTVSNVDQKTNLLKMEQWIPQVDGQLAGFPRNGSSTESKRISGIGPYGSTVLWKSVSAGDDGSNGGWTDASFPADRTKTYRFVTWYMRDPNAPKGVGSTYLGTNTCLSLSGKTNSNPYFKSFRTSSLDSWGIKQGEWYCIIGHMHFEGYTGGVDSSTGVYNERGEKVAGATDYKFYPTATSIRHRAYYYYETVKGATQFFAEPRLEIVDGTELPLSELLTTVRSTALKVEDKVTAASNRVSTLEETSTGHASRLSTVETKATTGVSKANAAQSTANSGVSKANTAQSTANTGVSKADAAQATADSVNTKVTAVTNRVGTLESTSSTHASRLTTVETKATTGVSKADAAQATANSGVSKANAAQSKANSADSKVNTVTNRVGTLEETSTGHASRLTSVETTATSGVSKANAAQSTANTAKTNAATAQAKADSADSKVNTVTNRVSTLETSDADKAQRISTVESIAAKSAEYTLNSAKNVLAYAESALDSSAAGGIVDLAKGFKVTGPRSGFSREFFQINPDRRYEIRVRARQAVNSSDNSNRLYAGVAPYDANKKEVARPSVGAGSYLYAAAAPKRLPTDGTWREYSAIMTGVGLSSRNFREGTRYVRLMFIASHIGKGSPVVDIEYLEIRDVTEVNAVDSRVSVIETASNANASRIESVNTSQGKAVASAKDIARAYTDTKTNVLKAERVIKADANGKVSGVHLLSKGSGVDAGGKLYFQADEIAIVPPNWNGSSELDKSKFPFYFSEDRNFMYLDEAVIRKLSAETIDSGSLVVNGLTLLSDNLSLPAGAVREHMIDPAFKDGLVRVNPDASIQGGTKAVSAKGVASSKKITVPTLESGGGRQTMTISIVGPNEPGKKDVQFDIAMKLNGVAHNFGWGTSKIHLVTHLDYSTEEGGVRLYRSSFKFEDHVTMLKPTKGGSYAYEFTITNVTLSPNNLSTRQYSEKLQISISVSEPSVSSGGFITDVRWNDIKEKPSLLGKSERAVDSAKLGGRSLSDSATKSSVAGRNSSGDIYARLFRPTYGDQNTISGAIAYRINSGSDNYIRFCSDKAAIRAFVDVYSKSEANGRYATAGHGHTGLSSNSWGGITSKTSGGVIEFGPANGSYAHIYTDRPSFYFNKELTVNGSQVYHTGNKPSPAAIGALALTGGLITGDFSVKATTRFTSANGACQRVDSRNEGTAGRAHWYGESTNGGTLNFRQAWYDGSSYVNVDVSGKTVTFGGAVDVQGGLKQDGHAILNGSDTWIRTAGEHGIYFSTFGGGLYMTDATWVRTYAGKSFFSSSTNTLESIKTDGGIRFKHQLYSASPTGEGGIVGYYATLGSSKDQMIWTIGKSWRTHAIHYGLGYHYGSEIDGSRRHQIVLKQNGVIGVHLGMDGNSKFQGTVTAADLIATSDRRVKDNIRVITDALNKVSKLSGNTYTRNDQGGVKAAGVIAQEVQTVLPESVVEAGGLLHVAHNGVIGLLVEAVKELKAKIDRLELCNG